MILFRWFDPKVFGERNKIEAPYVLCRDGVYYFVRRIPVDMQQHYDKCRLYFSLRTQSKTRAVRAAQSITQRLDDYLPNCSTII